MTSLKKSLKLSQGGVISIVGAGGKTSLMFRLAGELAQAGESVLTTTTTKIFLPTKQQSPKVVVTKSLLEILHEFKVNNKGNCHLTAAAEVLPGPDKVHSSHKNLEDYPKKLVGFPPEFIDEIHSTNIFRWILVEADGAAGRPLKTPGPHEPVIPESTTKIIGVLGLDGVGKPLNDDWIFRAKKFAEITGLREDETVTEAACISSMIHERGIMKGSSAMAERLIFLNKADQPGKLAVAERIVSLLRNKKNSGLQRIIIGQTLQDPPVVGFYDISQ